MLLTLSRALYPWNKRHPFSLRMDLLLGSRNHGNYLKIIIEGRKILERKILKEASTTFLKEK